MAHATYRRQTRPGEYKATCDCRPRDVEVVCYRHHHSAFAGYRRTRSAWSAVRCRRCGGRWRTRAGYADRAPMAADACPDDPGRDGPPR